MQRRWWRPACRGARSAVRAVGHGASAAARPAMRRTQCAGRCSRRAALPRVWLRLAIVAALCWQRALVL